MSLALTPDQPWLGLASYEEEHRPYFFGRRAEEDDLFERVRRHRLTVLYGPSGLGKTSLLRAGLMPRLTTAGWLPVRIRLTYPERLDTIVEADPQSLLQQVLESVASALQSAGHPTGEKLRAALSAPLPSSLIPLPSLWELWHDTAWGLREPSAPRPVLLFDQFEEIFTLGEDEARARSAARVLRDALADLIEDRPPPALDRRLSEDPEFAERFDFTPDTARVVLVLREDYLARLERWKQLLPGLLRNRLELRLLDGTRALEAITGPARIGRPDGDPGLVPDDVAAAIVRAVSDVSDDTPVEDIEAVPPLLSLLCKELNEKRRAASPAAAQLDLDLVRENRSAILQRFYEECFDGFPPAVRLVIEDHLLSPGGYRENPGYDTLVTALTARSVEDPAKVLAALVERRLITAEDRGGRRRVELTHDVLAPIVKRSLDERREREAAEDARRKLAEESAKARRRRTLVGAMALLTLLAIAGAFFGWHQAEAAKSAAKEAASAAREADHQRREALKNEKAATSEAARAEANLSKALSELDRATLEEGKAWLERARTAKEKGDHFQAIMLAGRAVGFRGYGIDKSIVEKGVRFHSLLGLPLEHNPEAEEERQTEQKAAADLIDSLKPPFLPCWVRAHEDSVRIVAFSPDGTRVASGSWGKTVKLWDAATGKELTTLSGHESTVSCVAFSPDGTRLASGSGDKTVKLWDAATGKELATLSGHEGAVYSVAFSPDGTRVASGSGDKTVKLWDAATGKELATLSGHEGAVYSVAFSPNGTRVASGSFDKTVKLWDAATGKELATLTGHKNSVRSVAFSPDGTRLASGSDDRTVKLWDAATGKGLATLSGHEDSVMSVAFSPNGTRLASGSLDQTVKLWDAATGKELAGKPDFRLNEGATTDSQRVARIDRIDISVIRISPTSPERPNLLHFEQQGLLDLEGKEFTWEKDVPLESINATTAIHYGGDPLAKLANPNTAPEESAVLRLQLCARNWRAGLAVWRQLVQETPSLADSAPARRELLTLAAAMLQLLAHAEKPTSPAELCTAITENLRAEDFTDLRISLALAQAAKAVLAKDTVFTPPLPADIREAFRAHLFKIAPKSWREAVADSK